MAALANTVVPASLTSAQEAALLPLTFTARQAGRGQGVFGNNSCPDCHGAHLEGLDEGPPLVGESFMANRFGGSVADLYSFILKFMPASNPGSLKPDQALSLVAFLAQKNGLVPGDTQMPTELDALERMGFQQLRGEVP